MPKITVGVRFRPENRKIDGLQINTTNGSISLSMSGTTHQFAFDKILDETCSQENVFSSFTTSIMKDVIDGFNGCIFAYGQTGAGKTFTMSGSDGDPSQRGLCTRVAESLFEYTRSTQDSLAFSLSIVEIYNETLLDLLREPVEVQLNNIHTPPPPSKLVIVETKEGMMVPGIRVLPISSYFDACDLLSDAQSNRVVAEHQLNRQSSRSHVIYTFYLTRTAYSGADQGGEEVDADVTQSKLHLVDLAGSERVNKTGSSGVVQKEANHINLSLSYLEQVVVALTKPNRDHIPYRQSKLTYLLKDSLGGNCNTHLIACIWPHQSHNWETLSTLRFAARMKCIETHAVRNKLLTEQGTSDYVQQINMLKRELAVREMLAGGKEKDISSHELTKGQKLKAYKQCYTLAQSPPIKKSAESRDGESLMVQENLDLHSLSHIKLLLGTFRAALWEACGQQGEEVGRVIKQVILESNEGTPGMIEKLENILTDQVPLPSLYTQQQQQQHHQTGKAPAKSGKLPNLTATMGGRPRKNSKSDGHKKGLPHFKSSPDLTLLQQPQFAEAGPAGDPLPSARSVSSNPAPTSESIPNTPQQDSHQQVQQQEVSEESSEQRFERFKENEGKHLSEAYEQAKEVLGSIKTRQRHIVSIINEQKKLIDEFTNVLREVERESMESENPGFNDWNNKCNEIKRQLAEAKAHYRSAHQELTECKTQLTETQSLKKRAVASLLSAFNESENPQESTEHEKNPHELDGTT